MSSRRFLLRRREGAEWLYVEDVTRAGLVTGWTTRAAKALTLDARTEAVVISDAIRRLVGCHVSIYALA